MKQALVVKQARIIAIRTFFWGQDSDEQCLRTYAALMRTSNAPKREPQWGKYLWAFFENAYVEEMQNYVLGLEQDIFNRFGDEA